MRFPLFDAFDLPDLHNSCSRRLATTTAPQALQLLNSTELQNKVAAQGGRLPAMLKEKNSDDVLIEELYLLVYGRKPREQEWTAVRAYVADQKDRKAAFEDLLWALLNTKEFLFNH